MTTTTEPRRHIGWFLIGWLVFIILYNGFTIVSYLTGGNNPLAYIVPENQSDAAPLVLIENIAAGAAILFAVVLLLGYRIGFYGILVASVVQVIFSLLLGFNIGSVLVVGMILLVLWALVRPAWERMR